ncbi:MAG: coproporphyrinogen dehydrogenase HemZ [Lachnospiraceae bacterium]|uniref:Coproporphyrinogen dehydrogenase HemZ n=1 Tax=Candidatus Weimeria bifida TaxID=2599074 RepID=A0A6N7IY32_9FIRM|nr:coproporphyrinogen dehydrogenase HemZ [Candidatus Weimeria bifida]RRF96754.1 MAG: coproporphyrinogen dehydrogenase HemZ [Lachnospiraceae bacterium]
MIELRENKRFFDNETGPLYRSFFPKSRLLVFCEGKLLGRESTEEKQERASVKPSAVLTLDFSDETASMEIEISGERQQASCPAEKNAVKRTLYSIVSSATGRALPWGSTTGIRPTKEALVMTLEGKDPDEIRGFYRKKYFTSEEKISESIEIAQAEKQILSRFPKTDSFEGHQDYNLETNGYSIYIGILFCPSICLYCSFSSHQIDAYHSLVPGYIASLKKEIDFVSECFKNRRLDCIYFGGGTPTTLTESELDDLFSYIEKKLDLSHLAEYTVEAGRPDSITPEKLRVMKAHGVTRISVNPQTMNQKTLDLIGRKHTVEDIIKAYELAREADFSCVNMDMILGLPGENAEDIRHTLTELSKLSPDNLTVHSLAVKTAARLRLEWDKYEDLDFTNSVGIMDEALETGRSMGMHPYYLYRQKNMAGSLENVGMAKPGKDGIYNVMIMEEREDIVALGAGASSKKVRSDGAGGVIISRCENVKDIKNYIERIDEMIDRKKQLFSDICL